MPAVLKSLPLTEEISNALPNHEGVLGDTLRVVLAYERYNWDEVNYSKLDLKTIKDAYLQSVSWAAKITSELVTRG